MVKLDVSLLRYLTKDDFRILTAVEMGMRNHELVPRSLVYSIAGIQSGCVSKILVNLTQNKFISYERGKRYDGYRLTYRGYDYLALNVLRNRGVINSIGHQIGVGKESDVYVASNDDGRKFAIKFHRLGRTCFRKVSEKRDYQRKSQNHKTASWIYLSRLAAMREFAFMKLLYEQKLLPIPEPIDVNRHCIVMELIDGTILNHIHADDIEDKKKIQEIYDKLMNIMSKLTNEYGVVHGDFNEFNILIKMDGSFDPVLIDFPQMISVNHELAEEYFERDVNCIQDFFAKRFGYEADYTPVFEVSPTDTSNDLHNLVDALENEEIIMENVDLKNNSGGFVDGKSELLSKFLNSFPPAVHDDISREDHDIDQQQQIEDATAKVMLEKRLHDLRITQEHENPDEQDRQSQQSDVYSTASTFSPGEIKSRLIKENKKKELRQRMRVNPKAIKGESSALRRHKKNDQKLANEDLKAYVDGSW